MNQAYVQYLAPVFDGVTIKAGRFGTLLGAEVAQTAQNFNITRGNVYNLLQPIDHMGVLAQTDLGESGFSISLGGVNGFATDDPDINEEKSLLTQVAWAGGATSLAASLLWGAETFNSGKEDRGTVDVVWTWDPSEDFSAWVNADYAWADPAGGPSSEGWGVAVAGRYAWTDRLGTSIRVEYAGDDDGLFGFASPSAALAPVDATIWSLTGTVDYALTDHLTLRSEVRWDTIDKQHSGDGEFFDDGTSVFLPGPASFTDLDDDQVVAGVEVIYEF